MEPADGFEPRPIDYKSIALPTVLCRHLRENLFFPQFLYILYKIFFKFSNYTT